MKTNKKRKDGTAIKERQRCEWFLLCENPATTTRPHSVLGLVPICDRCNQKLDSI